MYGPISCISDKLERRGRACMRQQASCILEDKQTSEQYWLRSTAREFVSHPILFYPILSYPILYYPILSHPILTYPIPSHPILPYSVFLRVCELQ
jgi:hypothetical protein